MEKLVRALAVAIALVVGSAGLTAEATHSESACGRLLEFVAPPSNDIAQGYGHVRLATATGDKSVLFHHTNPSGTPSKTERGATDQGTNVCISGPYVHVTGASPYVSPYDLRLATTTGTPPVASLPSTATASAVSTVSATASPVERPPVDPLPALILALTALAAVAVIAIARAQRAR